MNDRGSRPRHREAAEKLLADAFAEKEDQRERRVEGGGGVPHQPAAGCSRFTRHELVADLRHRDAGPPQPRHEGARIGNRIPENCTTSGRSRSNRVVRRRHAASRRTARTPRRRWRRVRRSHVGGPVRSELKDTLCHRDSDASSAQACGRCASSVLARRQQRHVSTRMHERIGHLIGEVRQAAEPVCFHDNDAHRPSQFLRPHTSRYSRCRRATFSAASNRVSTSRRAAGSTRRLPAGSSTSATAAARASTSPGGTRMPVIHPESSPDPRHGRADHRHSGRHRLGKRRGQRLRQAGQHEARGCRQNRGTS